MPAVAAKEVNADMGPKWVASIEVPGARIGTTILHRIGTLTVDVSGFDLPR